MSKLKQPLMMLTPEDYAAAAVVADAIGEQMLARLEWVLWQPKKIVDVGCGVGTSTRLLRERYPEALLTAVDSAYPMLQFAKQQDEKIHYIAADTLALPFADHSVDLVFANLLLPWCHDIEAVCREWKRILHPDGLLMFSSLGPDTLLAWRDLIGDITLPNFIDMHDVGDVLTRLKFSEPVLDVDFLTVTYRDLEKLFHELTATGMLLPGDHTALLTEAKQLRTDAGIYATQYEIIYGHAWGSVPMLEQSADETGVVNFPLSHLRRRR